MTTARRNFVRPWVLSAPVVSVARFLNADGPGHDLGRQILAAHNLLAGRGLSYYEHFGSDMSDPPTLVTLTHFPAGYSLLSAVLYAIGVDVGTAVKILGT